MAKKTSSGRRSKSSMDIALPETLRGGRRREVVSFIVSQFVSGKTTSSDIMAALKSQFKDSGPWENSIKNPERFWDIIRIAAQKGQLEYIPVKSEVISKELSKKYRAVERDQITVVETASQRALASVAARVILKKVQQKSLLGRTVHIGFAGGSTLRYVAKELARLIRTTTTNRPQHIIFHGILAAFDDAEDWEDDPNSFITYFVDPRYGCGMHTRVGFVRMTLPAILRNSVYQDLRQQLEFRRPFELASDVQIVVTSGSLWDDPFSAIRNQYIGFANRVFPDNEEQRYQLLEIFQQKNIVGDILWQPITVDGHHPFSTADFRLGTLFELKTISERIRDGSLDVVMVMGLSGKSKLPKSNLLRAVLDHMRECPLFTELIVDSPTADGALTP